MTWPWLQQNCVMYWPSFKYCSLQNVSNSDAVTGLTVCSLRKSPERGHWLKGKFCYYGGINSIQKVFDHAMYSLFRGLNDQLSYSVQKLIAPRTILCSGLSEVYSYIVHHEICLIISRGLFRGLNEGLCHIFQSGNCLTAWCSLWMMWKEKAI